MGAVERRRQHSLGNRARLLHAHQEDIRRHARRCFSQAAILLILLRAQLHHARRDQNAPPIPVQSQDAQGAPCADRIGAVSVVQHDQPAGLHPALQAVLERLQAGHAQGDLPQRQAQMPRRRRRQQQVGDVVDAV